MKPFLSLALAICPFLFFGQSFAQSKRSSEGIFQKNDIRAETNPPCTVGIRFDTEHAENLEEWLSGQKELNLLEKVQDLKTASDPLFKKENGISEKGLFSADTKNPQNKNFPKTEAL